MTDIRGIIKGILQRRHCFPRTSAAERLRCRLASGIRHCRGGGNTRNHNSGPGFGAWYHRGLSVTSNRNMTVRHAIYLDAKAIHLPPHQYAPLPTMRKLALNEERA